MTSAGDGILVAKGFVAWADMTMMVRRKNVVGGRNMASLNAAPRGPHFWISFNNGSLLWI